MNSSNDLGAPPSFASLISAQAIALFLDFDGTLVKLASGPDAIEPKGDLSRRLEDLSLRLDGRCAIVSGRGITDIEKHIGPLTIAAAGSHGSDIRGANGKVLGEGAIGLPPSIERKMRDFAVSRGLDYEAKPHGGALHYRSVPDAQDAANRFAKDLAAEHGWSAQSGKFVVEIVAASANKGAAVRTLMQEAAFKGARPFFIGDDLTDEAGFAACEEMGGAGILVGNSAETGARFVLANVEAVHDWLNL